MAEEKNISDFKIKKPATNQTTTPSSSDKNQKPIVEMPDMHKLTNTTTTGEKRASFC